MKQSHITTPRTLSECQFFVGYSSAPRGIDHQDKVAMVGAAVSIVMFLASIFIWG